MISTVEKRVVTTSLALPEELDTTLVVERVKVEVIVLLETGTDDDPVVEELPISSPDEDKTDKDDDSNPPDVEEDTGPDVCEEPPALDATEEAKLGEELLPVTEVVIGRELNVGVVVGPPTRQEHAEEIEEGEPWH